MKGAPLSGYVQMWVEPSVEGLESSDSAYQAAIQDLVDFTNDTSGVALISGSVDQAPLTKGSWEPLLMSVGSPTAVAALFRLWLHRDRKRSVKVRVAVPDAAPIEIEASGEAISLTSLQAALESAVKATLDAKS